jgi:RPA family protein
MIVELQYVGTLGTSDKVGTEDYYAGRVTNPTGNFVGLS